MNQTNIEWVKNPDGSQGYTWNPITGCLNHTPEGLCLGGLFPCYAYKLANGRLRERYWANTQVACEPIKPPWPSAINNPFYPRFWFNRVWELDISKQHYCQFRDGKGIFVCDMGELFGDWIPHEWQERIFEVIKMNWHHRFYLLTKQPQNLAKWSPFPDNCWVGVTATNYKMANEARYWLGKIKAKIKYLSIEPFLGPLRDRLNCLFQLDFQLDWLIIGVCTGRKAEIFELCQRYPELTPMPYGRIWTAQPKIEWVEEIVRAADQAGVPVFLKDNLEPLLRKVYHTLPTNMMP
jgi:protein gp37